MVVVERSELGRSDSCGGLGRAVRAGEWQEIVGCRSYRSHPFRLDHLSQRPAVGWLSGEKPRNVARSASLL